MQMRVTLNHDNQTRRELYQQWAINLEDLYNLGQAPILAKNQICSIILNTIKRQGATIDECNYACRVLPDTYKRKYELTSTNPTEIAFLPVTESATIADNIFSYTDYLGSVDPGHLTRQQHQEYYDQLFKLLHREEKACEDRHITLVEEFNDGYTPPPSQYEETIHMDKPEPVETRIDKACTVFEKKVHRFTSSFREYGPIKVETNEIDEEFVDKGIRMMEAFGAFFAPHIDKKWRSDWLLWHKHINDALDHGLHASMSMSRARTSNKIVKVFRGITREEIDAKAIVCLKFFKQFVEDMPGGLEVCEYFAAFKLPYRRDLSVKLNPKLSHQS